MPSSATSSPSPWASTSSMSAFISWCSRRSTWVDPTANSVCAPVPSSSSPPCPRRTFLRRCSMLVIRRVSTSMGLPVATSLTYTTQATLALCVHTSAANTLHWSSASTAKISDSRPVLSGPLSSIAVWSPIECIPTDLPGEPPPFFALGRLLPGPSAFSMYLMVLSSVTFCPCLFST